MSDSESSTASRSGGGAPRAPVVHSAAGVQGPGPGEEKRRHPRASVQLSVQLRFGTVQEFLNATAEDLSVSGIFLRSHHFEEGTSHEAGQLVTLQFEAGSRRMVQGVGKVVRVVHAQPGVEPGVAVEFLELDETSQKLVAAIVAIKLAQVAVR
jgi:c-di-GMP-binding flagellar brake protein YcgR